MKRTLFILTALLLVGNISYGFNSPVSYINSSTGELQNVGDSNPLPVKLSDTIVVTVAQDTNVNVTNNVTVQNTDITPIFINVEDVYSVHKSDSAVFDGTIQTLDLGDTYNDIVLTGDTDFIVYSDTTVRGFPLKADSLFPIKDSRYIYYKQKLSLAVGTFSVWAEKKED